MEFKGFEVFPVGEAKLHIEHGILRVNNIGNSGLDGVLIKFDGKGNEKHEKHKVHFGNVSQTAYDSTLKTTTLKTNSLGQVVTAFESFKWKNAAMDKVFAGYNPKLLPEKFTFFGTLHGETVFQFKSDELVVSLPYIDPEKPETPQVIMLPWMEIAVRSIITPLYHLFDRIIQRSTTKTTTTYREIDANGKLIKETVTITEDPHPFEVTVNGETFIINEYGIKYDVEYPTDLPGIIDWPSRVVGEQITGYNLTSFDILSID